jgi:hypothetical protein
LQTARLYARARTRQQAERALNERRCAAHLRAARDGEARRASRVCSQANIDACRARRTARAT